MSGQADNSGQQNDVDNQSQNDTSSNAGAGNVSNDANTNATTTGTTTTTSTTAAETHWYDDLPEDLRSHPKVQEFKDKAGITKSYLELHSLLGHEKIPIPKDENDTAAIAMMNKVRGVPTDEKGYTFEDAKLPEGLEKMNFGDEQFRQMALKHQLTQKQAQGIRDDYIGLLTDIREQQTKAFAAEVEASKAQLTKDWGLAYEAKVKLAQSVMNKFAGSEEAFEHLNAKIGTDPAAIKFLATVGEQFQEGSLGDLGTAQTRFTKTPTEAKQEYDRITSDPNDIYWAGVRNNQIVSESVRKERVAYVESLLTMAQPILTSAK